MSITNENWEKTDFQFKNFRTNYNILPTNQNLPKEVTADFMTYNANSSIPCYPYQLAVRECVNKYGVGRDFMSNRACVVS